MGFNKILIVLLMISSVMLTGCTSINLKYFSVGTNSRGMLEGNFDLVDVDETTKITGEDSLIKNTNKGTSIDDDEDANNFYNQPTGETSKTPINTNTNTNDSDNNDNDNDNDSSTTENKSKSANVGEASNGIVPQVK